MHGCVVEVGCSDSERDFKKEEISDRRQNSGVTVAGGAGRPCRAGAG